MSRLCRWFALVVAAVQLATAGGCAFGRKPYANDPLIRASRAVWGDREKAIDPDDARPEPETPPAPKALLVGEIAAVTSPP